MSSKASDFGCINYIYKTKDDKTRELSAICDWYNTQRTAGLNPDQLAALLQHKLVSLHAISDCNGRVSRILMNWSLESQGLAPSVPNPHDLVVSIQKHAQYVRVHRIKQTQSRNRVEAGEKDPVVIFGLEMEYAKFKANPNVNLAKLEYGVMQKAENFASFLRGLGSKALDTPPLPL